jgi:hypothetical protein
MTGFEEWFYEMETHSTRSDRFYEDLESISFPVFRAKAWLEAAYNQGFQDGYNSPMPPTDYV